MNECGVFTVHRTVFSSHCIWFEGIRFGRIWVRDRIRFHSPRVLSIIFSVRTDCAAEYDIIALHFIVYAPAVMQKRFLHRFPPTPFCLLEIGNEQDEKEE